jgi:hypothetical protein
MGDRLAEKSSGFFFCEVRYIEDCEDALKGSLFAKNGLI